MSTTTELTKKIRCIAPVFAALGDETRLSLLYQMGEAELCSVTQLAAGRRQTRQAIRKHLQILEDAQLVRSIWRGRENLFKIEPDALQVAAKQFAEISLQWQDALGRLKAFAEKEG